MWLLKLRCGEFGKKIEKNPQGSACVYFLSSFVLNIFAKPPKKVDLCQCPPALVRFPRSQVKGPLCKGHTEVVLLKKATLLCYRPEC